MIWVKSALIAMMWWAHIGEGSGGIGVYSSGFLEFFLLPVIAFVLGFWWSVRRARRKTRTVAGA
jgi:hypothetical protein